MPDPSAPAGRPPAATRDALTRTEHLLVHLAGELYTKSARTRRRFRGLLIANLRAALAARGVAATVLSDGTRMHVLSDELDAAAAVAADVFGVHRVERVVPLPYDSLDALATAVAERARPRVAGRTFAVRVHRRGTQAWTSIDANRAIGSQLIAASRGVDLRQPEVEVRVDVPDEVAYLVDEARPGAVGLPIGAQERSLVLLSGGYDSAVAAWQLLRRGSPVEFVHFRLECSASEHAALVAQTLTERWGAGYDPLLWMVDFQPVKEALLAKVSSRNRQVVLKQLMVAAADALADRLGIHALVTGDAVGQVSSQTVSHLAAIDACAHRAVLRPLCGALKDEIITRARAIGTADISARAQEVCDLSSGPVSVSARWTQLERAHRELPASLVADALAGAQVASLADWFPGADMVPVVEEPPPGIPLAMASGPLPDEGPVALHGARAASTACRLAREGRRVWVVLRPGGPPEPRP
ncbi:MAG: tRNA 4-thiouridine(8) synthase ThiI [Deltaproteobacteria bacterium]|nr:tRNA 4-thiouridine(8) synthase ThiI [Deltaproteobacteria bacterium]MCB9788373.1 tRNA 4-thiouridine(8) synthase ThiI [Deltaproteobacteria bacterium]